MRDIIANRRRVGYWRKARLLGILLRENGLAWSGLLCAYYITSMTAERTFARLQKMKLVNGLPGTSSLRINREIWENWDWTAGGDEWTPSPEWKESLVRSVLRRWIPENGNILEIGPGAGRWTEILLPMSNRFWGVDISERCIAICRERFSSYGTAEFYVTRGNDLASIPDNSVDALWSYDVFVHINQCELDAYLRDFVRVMRPGAVGVIHHGKSGGTQGGWRSDLSAESVTASDTILDVGVTSDRSYDHSNYLEAWYPHKSKITAVGIDEEAAFLRETYPGVRYVKGDGRSLPFADASFDYVHASAVLEHVGNASQQMAFIAEARRVARKGVFLTTPNRWYPIEFHTILPIIHWLPQKIFRRILIIIGKEFFASEQNLNLLSARQLRCMAKHIGFGDEYQVRGVRLAGLVSNLLFILVKKSQTRNQTIEPVKCAAEKVG